MNSLRKMAGVGKVVLLAAIAVLVLSSSAWAQEELDFTIPASNPGAVISYGGGADPLVGTKITVTDVTGVSTPDNNGTTFTCTKCVLAFTSGAEDGPWSWGAGGSITLTGTVDDGPDSVTGTLLSGTISSASVS